MYEHLDPKRRERLFQLQSKTPRTMSTEERAEYNALIAPHGIESITPAGQQVLEEYDGKASERNPYIGLWVTYYSRPGEGRNAKTRFPAMVTDVYGIDPRANRWKVKLMVVWNAVETTDVICLERSEEDRYGAWAYAEDPMWARYDALEARIALLEAKANGNGRPSPPRPK